MKNLAECMKQLPSNLKNLTLYLGENSFGESVENL